MLYTILIRYLTVFVQFLIIGTTIWLYGTDARGVVAGLIATFSLVGAISSFTIGKGLIELLERAKGSDLDKRSLYISTIAVSLFFVLLSFIAHSVLKNIFPTFYGNIPTDTIKYFYPAVFYYVWIQVGSYLYSLSSKLKIYNSISLVSNCSVMIGLGWIALFDKIAFEKFLLFISTVFFIEFLVSLSVFYRVMSLKSVKPKYKNLVFKSGVKLHIDTIGGVMFSSISLVLVNAYLTLEDVANYDIAVRLFALLCVMPQMVQMFNHDKVVYEDSRLLIESQMRLLKKVAVLFLLLFPFSLLILFQLRSWINFSNEIIWLYTILALGFLPYFYCSIVSPYWIKHKNGLKLSFISLSIGTIGVCISIYLMGIFGVLGAAVSVVLNYLMAMVINSFYHKARI